MRVDVETVSQLSAGQTVCDVWHQSSKPKNVGVAQVIQQPFVMSVVASLCMHASVQIQGVCKRKAVATDKLLQQGVWQAATMLCAKLLLVEACDSHACIWFVSLHDYTCASACCCWCSSVWESERLYAEHPAQYMQPLDTQYRVFQYCLRGLWHHKFCCIHVQISTLLSVQSYGSWRERKSLCC